MNIDNIIKKIMAEKPEEHSPFNYGEWYDGWSDAIKYVVSILEEEKERPKRIPHSHGSNTQWT